MEDKNGGDGEVEYEFTVDSSDFYEILNVPRTVNSFKIFHFSINKPKLIFRPIKLI